MTNRYVPNPGPRVSTPLVTRLLDQLDQYARRNPDVIPAVQRVRRGDDEVLAQFIRRIQSGDQEAAVVVLGALVPILSKLVLRRYPKLHWGPTLDDYLTIAHMTLAEARLADPPARVLSKVLARTRRRYARRFENRNSGVVPVADLTLTADPFDLEQAAIARITLNELTTAVNQGLLRPNDWRLLRTVAAQDAPTVRMTGAERQRLLRARKALAEFRDWRVAA